MSKFIQPVFTGIILCTAIFSCNSNKQRNMASAVQPKTEDSILAITPPMGWNSFDAYDCRITESEFRANVDVMAQKLLPYGYNYAVLDYIWFNDNPGSNPMVGKRKGHPDIKTGVGGQPEERLQMDEYGRLLPSEIRFPSSKNGLGLKPLADYVHGKGLKFGLHIMRGIPVQAYFDSCKIMGSTALATEIAEPFDQCSWCNNMYGVDATKPGAQAYYNSLFRLYAEWGVDLIKADDMMVPNYSKGEVELMNNAIKQCGRPMVLSLSCGEAPLGFAHHMQANSNMWRISTDFWDKWESLYHNFELMNAWSSFAGPGHWPDADMLPVGRLSLQDRPHGNERNSAFTKDEQYTLMNLWAIAQSPLMIGADLLTLDDFTLSLLTNSEVLNVNQHSKHPKQVLRSGNSVVWISENQLEGVYNAALFNIGESVQDVKLSFAQAGFPLNKYNVRDLWKKADLGSFTDFFQTSIPPHGSVIITLK